MKDFKKIRFESNGDLPLNKPLKLRLLTVIIRSVFSENDKFYPQLLCTLWIKKMLRYQKIDVSEGMM